MKWLIGAMAITAAAVSGCSKPTAEEYFAKAEEAERQASKTMDSVRTEAEARALFQPVIISFEKVITEYPTHGLAEAALFRLANIRNNNTHEVQRAVDTYKQYIEQYPRGQQVELAMFLVGYLYNNELHNLDSAAAAYKTFLHRFPESQFAVSAQFELNTLGKAPEELIPQRPAPEKPTPKRQPRKPAT